MGFSNYIMLLGFILVGIGIAYSELSEGMIVGTNSVPFLSAGLLILMFWYSILYPRQKKAEEDKWLNGY